MKQDYYVEVCDACLRASCWHGIFMCDKARYAGTVVKRASELFALKLEHSDYYSENALLQVCGHIDYVE